MITGIKRSLLLFALGLCSAGFSTSGGFQSLPPTNNQTADLTPISTNLTSLPYRVRLEIADFQLPNGLQSFVYAKHKGKWLLLAGRTKALHAFAGNDFPA